MNVLNLNAHLRKMLNILAFWLLVIPSGSLEKQLSWLSFTLPMITQELLSTPDTVDVVAVADKLCFSQLQV